MKPIFIISLCLLFTSCGGGGSGSSADPVQNAIAQWQAAEQVCDTLPLKENGAAVDPQEVLRVLNKYATVPYSAETGAEHYETACEVQDRGWADCEGQAAYGYRALREYNRWSDWDIWIVQVLITRPSGTWRHVFLRVGDYAFDPNNGGAWKVYGYGFYVRSVKVENVYNQWG